MNRFIKICFWTAVVFATSSTSASSPFRMDTSTYVLSPESKNILQKVEMERRRIALTYKTADIRFFHLLDSTLQFISVQPVSIEKKNQYLTRLHFFLQNINHPNSEGYFKSGSYYTTLRCYALMVEWDQRNELLENLICFSVFFVKATSLIPTDTVAEVFLSNYLQDYPDDIFRYVEEFNDRKFALSVLEKAVRTAPESAKRYFVTTNQINTILSSSNDLFVKKAYEVFSRFGIKSHAYLLLNEMINNQMSLEEAELLSNNPDKMFHLLLQSAALPQSTFSYSTYRFIDNHCIDVMRKNSSADLHSAANSLKHYTAEEMFALLCYGHKECTYNSFKELLDILKGKSTLVNGTIIRALNKEKLKELIIYCEKNNALQELLSVVDEKEKDYLVSVKTMGKKGNAVPVFKVFETANSISRKEPNNPPSNSVPHTIYVSKPNQTVPASTNKGTAMTAPNNLTSSAENTILIPIAKAEVVPVPIVEPVEPVKIILDDKLRTKVTLQKNILHTIQNIPAFIKQEYAEDLLNYAAQKEPDELFKKVEAFKDNRFSKSVLEQCAVNAPVSVKRYLYNPRHPVNFILQYSTDPAVKKIFEIQPQIGSKSKPLLLLNDILYEKLSVKDAIAISSEPDKLFHALVKTISRSQYVGRYSIDHEMRNYSLRFIREINDKIAIGEAQPFRSAENFSSTDLYFLMLYGRDEVFTSTFNGLFSRFMHKLPKEDGDAFLRSVNHNQFRDFLSLCSTFGTLEDFLTRFTTDSKQKLLVSYISDLETEKDDLSTIVLVAEAISNLSDYQLLTLLQTHIKKEYERVKGVNDPIGISIYGVLSSMISGNAKVETVWYKKIAEQFRVSPVSSLTSRSLFNPAKICVQQMYFYNDEDGRSSFMNFMNTYKNHQAWIIEDRKTYVRLYSKDGLRVEVFANKPEFEETGAAAISKYLKEKAISPSVVIHRGHSFHTESTLEKIPASAKLVFVGSCGGFYKVSIALENAPDAHIISTKQMGTKLINDAMLFSLNENIRGGKDIVWNDFWDKMRLKLGGNQYFSDYIPPNKNLEAIFIRAYYKLLGV